MYLGLDVEVHYAYNDDENLAKGAWLINSTTDAMEFRKFLEDMQPRDFISARIVHRDSGEEFEVRSRDRLIEETYKWLAKPPREHK